MVALTACNRGSQINKDTITIAFGSCSNPNEEDKQIWSEIINQNPSHFVWLGDAIYPKNYDLVEMDSLFKKQRLSRGYQALQKMVKIEGCYDDHDYGINDGGEENPNKEIKKNLFLDFINVSKGDERRKNGRGIYYSKKLANDIKLIILDTRYYRSALKPSNIAKRRYDPTDQGSMLGGLQWQWLEHEVKNTDHQIVIIVSSIQVLNDYHYYEKWGNMPHERTRLINLLSANSSNKYLILSGDRHFSEVMVLKGIAEITCSGLTQVYTGANEVNPNRISPFINKGNFGVLKIKKFGKAYTLDCTFIGKDDTNYHTAEILKF
jgi:alkaline phosphatase D